MTNAIVNHTSSESPALHGVLVHNTSGPGKLIRVDGAAARTAGATVITGQHLLDLDPYIGPVVRDQPLLAIDRVRYTGEPVALVFADDPDSARAAAALVTYEVGPLAPCATGAAHGQPPLVHLIEMLRPGPLHQPDLILPSRSNALIRIQCLAESRATPSARSDVASFSLPASGMDGPLRVEAAIDGPNVRLASASTGTAEVGEQLAQLFDPVGLAIDRTPGSCASPLAIAVDALAIAAARSTHRPVQLTAAPEAFGWSGPRGRVEVDGAEATLTVDAGASAGLLPLWLDELSERLMERLLTRALTVTITYSESPPIAATLDDWREALSRV